MREKSRVTVKIWGCMVVFEEIIKSIACAFSMFFFYFYFFFFVYLDAKS